MGINEDKKGEKRRASSKPRTEKTVENIKSALDDMLKNFKHVDVRNKEIVEESIDIIRQLKAKGASISEIHATMHAAGFTASAETLKKYVNELNPDRKKKAPIESRRMPEPASTAQPVKTPKVPPAESKPIAVQVPVSPPVQAPTIPPAQAPNQKQLEVLAEQVREMIRRDKTQHACKTPFDPNNVKIIDDNVCVLCAKCNIWTKYKR